MDLGHGLNCVEQDERQRESRRRDLIKGVNLFPLPLFSFNFLLNVRELKCTYMEFIVLIMMGEITA